MMSREKRRQGENGDDHENWRHLFEIHVPPQTEEHDKEAEGNQAGTESESRDPASDFMSIHREDREKKSADHGQAAKHGSPGEGAVPEDLAFGAEPGAVDHDRFAESDGKTRGNAGEGASTRGPPETFAERRRILASSMDIDIFFERGCWPLPPPLRSRLVRHRRGRNRACSSSLRIHQNTKPSMVGASAAQKPRAAETIASVGPINSPSKTSCAASRMPSPAMVKGLMTVTKIWMAEPNVIFQKSTPSAPIAQRSEVVHDGGREMDQEGQEENLEDHPRVDRDMRMRSARFG